MRRKLVWALVLLIPAAVCAAQDSAVVKDTQTRKPVTGDPVVSVSPSNPHPGLPPGALSAGGRVEREAENARWESAKWTRATLQLPGTTQKSVIVPAAGTVLVRASWPGPSAVGVAIQKGGATLATATPVKRFDGAMVATTQAKVSTAGEVVIRATGSGSQLVKVDLYVGILEAAR